MLTATSAQLSETRAQGPRRVLGVAGVVALLCAPLVILRAIHVADAPTLKDESSRNILDGFVEAVEGGVGAVESIGTPGMGEPLPMPG